MPISCGFYNLQQSVGKIENRLNGTEYGRHFVSGRPSDDHENVDYCPTKFLKGREISHTRHVEHINLKLKKVTNLTFNFISQYFGMFNKSYTKLTTFTNPTILITTTIIKWFYLCIFLLEMDILPSLLLTPCCWFCCLMLGTSVFISRIWWFSSDNEKR